MNSSKRNPIGGFFELELSKVKHYHIDAVNLNLGRSCLEYIVRSTKYKTIYVPHYTCSVLFDRLATLDIIVERYHLNERLEIDLNLKQIKGDTLFMYTNYFGLKDKYIAAISEMIKNLIIDNCQAFFSKPIENVNSFYSPRKFFGVPDGAYLVTEKIYTKVLKRDVSSDRLKHLTERIEYGPQKAFKNFQNHEVDLNNEGLKAMSKLTSGMLQSINYEKAAKIRNDNYRFLHEKLGASNNLKLDFELNLSPMVYPYVSNKEYLRAKLIDNEVFVATYWPNVFKDCSIDSLEYNFAKNILPLPIDQRYGKKEMEFIAQLILE
ncbi:MULTISPECIES: hypothetical protein [Aequorivita]|uniref:DegT/DnrJ/EryC1/StrS aminotransferase family protein n=1 Tax=Aequorivita iocasae TaxID=2803865 RepID=A0ABX7DT57_9FLAO|nr:MULTISPECIES: hypothetical protein [Aequorivita]QQX76801.1 hypothetical protein JK629_00570 [Aequorivita iocasae]UCA56273.1 hypothetical protein LDL78_00575 [Aequorivita sp. F7]